MFYVVDERVEGCASELFAELASELDDMQVVPEPPGNATVDLVVFRPENVWAPDSLSSTHFSRINKLHFLDQFSPHVLRSIRAGTTKLAFDISREATYLDYAAMTDLHHNLGLRDISPSNCILISANSDFARQYNGFCQNENINTPMTITYFNYYFYAPAKRYSASLKTDFESRASQFRARLDNPYIKDFMCLNFAPRAHRVYLLIRLIKLGLDGRGIISLSNMRASPKSISSLLTLSQIQGALDNGDEVEGMFNELSERSPLIVDFDTTDLVTSEMMEFPLPTTQALMSLYTITTETIYLAPLYQFTTEKTLKPFALFHPAITVGNPRTLEFTESLGFRRFEPFINECYDLITDNRLRMEAIIDEVKRISALSIAKRRAWALDLWPVTLENAHHLAFNLVPILQKRWREPLFKAICYIY